MRNVLRFSLMFIASVLPLLSQPHRLSQRNRKRYRGRLLPLDKSFVVVAEERFVDNGDGTVTDTKRENNVAEGR